MKLRRFLSFLVWLCLGLAAMSVSCFAEDAKEISDMSLIVPGSAVGHPTSLFDGDLEGTVSYYSGAWFSLSHEDGIGSLYLTFGKEYPSMTLTDNDTGEEMPVRVNGILHKYIDVTSLFGHTVHSVKVKFDSGSACLIELQVFTPGEVPAWVQKWEEPAEGEADLLLLSAHGDDEQLFFAGLIPYYAGQMNYQVQVVYFTDHRNITQTRMHEMLNGLWAVGLRTYPVFGSQPDIKTKDLESIQAQYAARNYSRQRMLDFVAEQIYRFRPLVVVTHDVNGEYGHGMHMLCADLVKEAVNLIGEGGAYPEFIEQYGDWDVQKTYLHLYEENPIVMDYDKPLDAFDGKTAYEVSRDLGFPEHKSQYSDFAWFYEGASKASEVEKYSPCNYGLYRSTVGADVKKNDMFENVRRSAETAAQEPIEETVETEPEIVEETTLPETEPTEAPTAEPVVLQQIPAGNEGSWLLLPGIGAALLLFAAVVFSRLQKKNEKK